MNSTRTLLIVFLAATLCLGAARGKKALSSAVTSTGERSLNAGTQIIPAAGIPQTPSTTVPTVIATPSSEAANPPTPATSMNSASYTMDWYSINGGGAGDISSASYKLGASAGQSVAGEAASTNYKMGIGFWYGAAGGCSCPHQGDMQLPNGSGAIDVNDVLYIIKVAFVNGTDVQDAQCPKTRSNVNNLGPVDVNDVLYIIKTAFSNGPNPVNPCGP